jgi:hypothetical protein
MRAAIDVLNLTNAQVHTIDNPEFEKAGKVMDWRNHVPAELKEHWDELSGDAKAVAFSMAQSLAEMEEWE